MAKSATVMANLGLNAKGFNAGLRKAQGNLGKFAKQSKSTFGVGFGTVAIGAAASKIVDYADKLDKTSKKLGITTDFLQKFRFAAEQTGVSTNTTDMALQRFSRRLGEAAQGGGELLPVLEQYNISVKDASGNTRSTEAVMADLAETIKGIEDPQERLRVAFKAFDSEGAALVTTLSEGKAGLQAFGEQAQKTGQIIDEDNIATLVEFKDQMNILSKAAMKAGTVIVGAFLNAGKVIGAVVGLIATRDLGAFKEVVSKIGTSMEKLEKTSKKKLKNVTAVTKASKKLTTEEKKQSVAAEKTLKKRAKEVVEILKKAEAHKEANRLAMQEIRILELLAQGRDKEAAAIQKKLDIEKETARIMKEQGLTQEEATAQAATRLGLEEQAAAIARQGGGGGGSGTSGSVGTSGLSAGTIRENAFAQAAGIRPDFAGEFISLVKEKLASGQDIIMAERNARVQLNRETDRASDTGRAAESLRNMFDMREDSAMNIADRLDFLRELESQVFDSQFKNVKDSLGGGGAGGKKGDPEGMIPIIKEDPIKQTKAQQLEQTQNTQAENIALILKELERLNEGLQ